MSIGSSGSVTVSATTRGSVVRDMTVTRSPPGAARARPCSSAEQLGQLGAVLAEAAARGGVGRPCRARSASPGSSTSVEDVAHLVADGRRVDGDAGGGQPRLDVGGGEEVGQQRPDRVDAVLRPAVRLRRAVAEPQQPAARRGRGGRPARCTPFAAIAASTGSRDSRSRANTASRKVEATSSRTIVCAKSPFGRRDQRGAAELVGVPEVGQRVLVGDRLGGQRRASGRARRPSRRGPAAAGPGRAGRGRCWRARPPPRAPARR